MGKDCTLLLSNGHAGMPGRDPSSKKGARRGTAVQASPRILDVCSINDICNVFLQLWLLAFHANILYSLPSASPVLH